MKLSDRLSAVVKNLEVRFGPAFMPLDVRNELYAIAFELWEEEQSEILAQEAMRPREFPSALAVQEGGNHYKKTGIQPVQYMHANNLDYNRGAVVKYVTRDRTKGGAEDVKKAIHFCQFILEMDYDIRSMPMKYER